MFTTNAALNYHCKSKHNDQTDADGNERAINDDNSIVETTSTKSQTTQGPAKRANKRKIPKIVYVMPGKSEPDIQPKKTKVVNSKIEIQTITSIPIYIVDN